MTIILYDIPSPFPNKAFSFNTWKARFALNYKGLPYKTEWVEFPDIEALCKKLGIAPTEPKPTSTGGGPLYTLPAIYDPATNTYISESLRIASYLDATYPSTPSLFPHNTQGVQAGFCDAFKAHVSPIFRFGIPQLAGTLSPRSAAYVRQTREEWLGAPIDKILPHGEEAKEVWAKVQAAWGKADEWYALNGGRGVFLMGEKPCFADLLVASFLIWVKTIYGEDDQKWKDLASWNGGRWKRLLDGLEKYSQVV
ncbi:hypothetical protein CVT26_011267 [Gymnopilus dilepis]|uniref:GST N-terminal domain-containing protein n=1 Tax=Gymnopilus dilepis TaxID=231916 RepID=A0A409VJH1_9AGAR|nr:hypothetical protein CVT26_011267 [Gymnopilus dilepis]